MPRAQRTLYVFGAILILFSLAACVSQAPPVVEKTPQSPDQLSLDPTVLHGTLENGLDYYIKENSKPEQRLQLRLVVNAGSVLETDSQRGLAHFVEHMAFNGTENYEKHRIIDYLEKSGMSFGPDINAYTSFDQTVYKLDLPSDSMETLRTGIDILKEWAFRISFDPEEVEKERQVIIEEWRGGRNAAARLRDEYLPVLLRNSRYADRLPIGSMDVVREADPEELREFYSSWYSPEHMALIAVGDVDPQKIEALIQEFFAPIKPGSAEERPSYQVPEADAPAYTVALDPEARQTSLQVIQLQDPFVVRSEEEYRSSLARSLYRRMISSRLSEKVEQADPPFVYGYFSLSNFLRNNGAAVWGATVQEGKVEEALEALLLEKRRVEEYGFSEIELERAKKNLRTQLQRRYAERDKTDSGSLVQEYISHFLTGQAAPGIEREWELAQKFLDDIELSEIERLQSEYVRKGGAQTVIVTGPEKEGLEYPSEAELEDIFRQMQEKKVQPYRDEFSGASLLEEIPPAGTVTEDQPQLDGGYHRLSLSNGAEVLYKQTSFKNEQILFNAFSPGGVSKVDTEDYFAARLAPSFVDAMGLSDYSPSELKKLLSGRQVSVSPYIHELYEGFSGSSRPQDMEVLFQLVHLYFSSPRQDTALFHSYRQRLADVLKNRRSDPQVQLSDAVTELLFDSNPRRRPLTSKEVEALGMEQVYSIFRQRFASPSDFTFVFVGNIDPAELKRLSAAYLASLNAGPEEKWRDRGVRFTREEKVEELSSGIAEKSTVVRLFSGQKEWSIEDETRLAALQEILQIRLRESVREEAGGTYNVGVSISSSTEPVDRYLISLNFNCDPTRVDELNAIIDDELSRLQEESVSQEYIEKAQNILLKSLEEARETNGYWLSNISRAAQLGLDPTALLNEKNRIEEIGSEEIRRTASEYLGGAVEVQAVLYPER